MAKRILFLDSPFYIEETARQLQRQSDVSCDLTKSLEIGMKGIEAGDYSAVILEPMEVASPEEHAGLHTLVDLTLSKQVPLLVFSSEFKENLKSSFLLSSYNHIEYFHKEDEERFYQRVKELTA